MEKNTGGECVVLPRRKSRNLPAIWRDSFIYGIKNNDEDYQYRSISKSKGGSRKLSESKSSSMLFFVNRNKNKKPKQNHVDIKESELQLFVDRDPVLAIEKILFKKYNNEFDSIVPGRMDLFAINNMDEFESNGGTGNRGVYGSKLGNSGTSLYLDSDMHDYEALSLHKPAKSQSSSNSQTSRGTRVAAFNDSHLSFSLHTLSANNSTHSFAKTNSSYRHCPPQHSGLLLENLDNSSCTTFKHSNTTSQCDIDSADLSTNLVKQAQSTSKQGHSKQKMASISSTGTQQHNSSELNGLLAAKAGKENSVVELQREKANSSSGVTLVSLLNSKDRVFSSQRHHNVKLMETLEETRFEDFPEPEPRAETELSIQNLSATDSRKLNRDTFDQILDIDFSSTRDRSKKKTRTMYYPNITNHCGYNSVRNNDVASHNRLLKSQSCYVGSICSSEADSGSSTNRKHQIKELCDALDKLNTKIKPNYREDSDSSDFDKHIINSGSDISNRHMGVSNQFDSDMQFENGEGFRNKRLVDKWGSVFDPGFDTDSEKSFSIRENLSMVDLKQLKEKEQNLDQALSTLNKINRSAFEKLTLNSVVYSKKKGEATKDNNMYDLRNWGSLGSFDNVAIQNSSTAELRQNRNLNLDKNWRHGVDLEGYLGLDQEATVNWEYLLGVDTHEERHEYLKDLEMLKSVQFQGFERNSNDNKNCSPKKSNRKSILKPHSSVSNLILKTGRYIKQRSSLLFYGTSGSGSGNSINSMLSSQESYTLGTDSYTHKRRNYTDNRIKLVPKPKTSQTTDYKQKPKKTLGTHISMIFGGKGAKGDLSLSSEKAKFQNQPKIKTVVKNGKTKLKENPNRLTTKLSLFEFRKSDKIHPATPKNNPGHLCGGRTKGCNCRTCLARDKTLVTLQAQSAKKNTKSFNTEQPATFAENRSFADLPKKNDWRGSILSFLSTKK